MSNWRQAGVNYIRYSSIAARLVRQALKPEMRTEAAKREDSTIRFTAWKDGSNKGLMAPSLRPLAGVLLKGQRVPGVREAAFILH